MVSSQLSFPLEIFSRRKLSFPYQVLAVIGKGSSLHRLMLKPADYNVKSQTLLFCSLCSAKVFQCRAVFLMQITMIFPAGTYQVTQSLMPCQQGILHFQQFLPETVNGKKTRMVKALWLLHLGGCSFHFLIFIQCFARFNSLYWISPLPDWKKFPWIFSLPSLFADHPAALLIGELSD